MMAQLVPIDRLVESPLNPRKHFDPVRLGELAASMAGGVGIIAPLVVRRNGTPDTYEVIDGARRLRAAQLAGVTEAPIVVRDLDDVQVLEMMLVSNNQREDVHPLEEAEGYAALMHAAAGYTVEAIALKVGKSSSYVYQRLKLLQLTEPAQKAFYAGEITIAHAVRLARLTPEQQGDALEECTVRDLFHGGPERDDVREPAPVHVLDQWIASHVRERVHAEETAYYFPDLLAQVEAIREAEPAAKLLELSESYHVNQDLGTKKHGALGRGRWTAIRTARERCPNVQRGVVVHGGPIRVLEVCATKGCPKHFPAAQKPAGSSQSREEFQAAAQRQREEAEARRRKTEEERQAWEALQPKALRAFAAHVASLPVTPELIKLLVGPYVLAQATRHTGPVTAKNLGQVLALAIVYSYDIFSRETFLRAVKPFKFNLGHVEQAEKPAAAKPERAAKKTPTARKAKPAARRSKKAAKARRNV